jgi:peroxiredoxin
MSRSVAPMVVLVAVTSALPLPVTAQERVPVGREWRYAGTATWTQAVPGHKPEVDKSTPTVVATVLGKEGNRPEVVQFRAEPPTWGLVWISASGPEMIQPPVGSSWPGRMQLANALNLPAPFPTGLKPGGQWTTKVPLPPFLFPVALRHRVVRTEKLDSHPCCLVERTVASNLPLETQTPGGPYRLLAYRERFWVDRRSAGVVKYEGAARMEEPAPDGVATVRLTTSLELREVRRLSDPEIQERHQQAQLLSEVTEVFAHETIANDESQSRQAQEKLKRFRQRFPTSPYLAAASGLEERLRHALFVAEGESRRIALPGQMMPDVPLRSLDGKEQTLGSYRGNILLLSFFTSWCGPCQAEAPHLEAEYWRKMRQQGVMVIGIDVAQAEHGDATEKAREFQKRHNLTYPVLVDSDGKAQRAFGVNAFPTTAVVDREGRIRYIDAGYGGRTERAISNIIRALVETPKASQ